MATMRHGGWKLSHDQFRNADHSTGLIDHRNGQKRMDVTMLYELTGWERKSLLYAITATIACANTSYGEDYALDCSVEHYALDGFTA